jgi:phenylpropionate dioxygenase-like ring-hydroxylating dioxygenase large terminal subunit
MVIGGLEIDPQTVEDALARDMTFPARWYSDPAIYDFELERIFTRAWQYAGPLEKLNQPGDQIVSQVGHVPVLVTRDRDGELHGLLNVCRHRAYPVASCDGHRMTLQCRYHAWTYELDGRLHKAPRAEREACFQAQEYSLLPVSVDTWGGLVFVNPDPGATPLRECFSELEPLARARGLDFSGYRYHSRYSYEIEANWKVWVENASECYHCPTIHTHSFSDAFIDDADVYQYVDGHRVLGQFTRYNPRARSYRHDPREGDREFRYIYPEVAGKYRLLIGRDP